MHKLLREAYQKYPSASELSSSHLYVITSAFITYINFFILDLLALIASMFKDKKKKKKARKKLICKTLIYISEYKILRENNKTNLSQSRARKIISEILKSLKALKIQQLKKLPLFFTIQCHVYFKYDLEGMKNLLRTAPAFPYSYFQRHFPSQQFSLRDQSVSLRHRTCSAL